MKIVYYIPSLFIAGGLERVITAKANYLADILGYEVTIVTSEQQSKKVHYSLSPRVRLHDLGVVIDAPKFNSLLVKIATYPWKYLLFKKRFSAFLLRVKPDITISTLRRESNFITAIQDGSIKIGELHITRDARSPISGKIRRFSKRVNLFLERRFTEKLNRFSRIVLLTREEQEMWPELCNTVVIPNFQEMVCDPPARVENKKAIAVGRYVHQKGFDLLVEAWDMVVRKHPDWSLYIYGEGDRAGIEQRIRERGLGSSLVAEGKTHGIIEKYQESSIFVLSSRYEGFGMVLTEAMTCGVPPVSFACPTGPRDIITEGVDGLLVENGNIEMLADKISYLIENEELRKQMGENARVNVRRFSKEAIMLKWEDLFTSLVENEKMTLIKNVEA